MMEINVLGLLFDAGLFVLAWMVQLIVYPGFLCYSPSELLEWHRKYTPRITVIVAPLMISQVVLSLNQLIREPNIISIIVFTLIVGIWLVTFLLFVPLHQKIDKGDAQHKDLLRLVRFSWYRTIPWTLVLIINLINYLN